jgi:hypothetical protein
LVVVVNQGDGVLWGGHECGAGNQWKGLATRRKSGRRGNLLAMGVPEVSVSAR